MYTVNSIYKTIAPDVLGGQKIAVVSFSGCNLWSGEAAEREAGAGACAKWCDGNFMGGQPLSAEDILTAIEHIYPARLGITKERTVRLTGGEPLLQVDHALVGLLAANDWLVTIETNGTIDADPLGDEVYLIVSPKLGSELKITRADELRVIIPGALPPDPGWTEEALLALDKALLQPGIKTLVPQDPIDPTKLADSFLVTLGDKVGLAGIYQLNLQRCVTFVNTHPDWYLQLQTNKLAGLP